MKKFLERFDQINPKLIYLLMAVALVFPVLKPLGMPISIDEQQTLPVYNWIENLNAGDIVIFDAAYGGGSDSELGPQLKAWFTHCMKKGVKVVGVAQWNDGATLAYETLLQLAPALEAKGLSCKYGVDWVMVGFKGAAGAAATATTWRAMQDDFWKTCANLDWVGNDFSALPLMARVRKWDRATISGAICYSAGSPGIPTYITYFPDQDLYIGNVAVQVAGSASYLRSGQAKGILPGLSGAAQYEKLIGEPGLGTKLMDAQSLGHLIVILLVILGNVGYRLKMKSAREG